MFSNYGELWTINPEIRTDNTDVQVLYFFFKKFDDFDLFFYYIGNRDDMSCVGEIQHWETIVNPALSTLMDLMSNRVLYTSNNDMTYFWNKMTHYIFEGHKAPYYSQAYHRRYSEWDDDSKSHTTYANYSKFKNIPHAGDEDV